MKGRKEEKKKRRKVERKKGRKEKRKKGRWEEKKKERPLHKANISLGELCSGTRSTNTLRYLR
jgi:hypothetical protein